MADWLQMTGMELKSVTPEISIDLLNSAFDFITLRFRRQSENWDPPLCFGGTHALNFTCESKSLAASVIFCAGKLLPSEKLSKIRAPMLIVYGDQD